MTLTDLELCEKELQTAGMADDRDRAHLLATWAVKWGSKLLRLAQAAKPKPAVEQKVTVGRSVHFYNGTDSMPRAATVNRVDSHDLSIVDLTVFLSVWDGAGSSPYHTLKYTSVVHFKEHPPESVEPGVAYTPFWTWPPRV